MKNSRHDGRRKHDRNQKPQSANKLLGTISITSKGTGYVRVLDRKEDVEVDFKHLKTALHGDTVEIVLHPKAGGRDTGEGARVVGGAKTPFAGVLEEENKLFFLKPDDTKMYTDILIPPAMLGDAKAGQKVMVEIVSWSDPRKAPEGKIVKVLGMPGDNNT